MDVNNRLRNNLVRKIQRLSTDKLNEINNFINNIENKVSSKNETLKLAGTWKTFGDDIFIDLTEKLHDNRGNDRKLIDL